MIENDTSNVDLLVKNIEIADDKSSATLYLFNGTARTVSGLNKIYSWNDEDIIDREIITDDISKFVTKGILLSGDTKVLLKLDSGDDIDLTSSDKVFDVEIFEPGMFYSAGSVVYYEGNRFLSIESSQTDIVPTNNTIVWIKIEDSDLFSRECELYDTRLHVLIDIGEYSEPTLEYSQIDSLWKLLFNMEPVNIVDNMDLKNVIEPISDGVRVVNGIVEKQDETIGTFGFKSILTKATSVSRFYAVVSIDDCNELDTTNKIEFNLTGSTIDNTSRLSFDYHSIKANEDDDGNTTISYYHENRKTEDDVYSELQEPVVISDEYNLSNKTFIVSFNINNDIVAPMVEITIPHNGNYSGTGKISPEFTMSELAIEY